MKVLFSLIFILLIGAATFYFTRSTDTNQTNDLTIIEKLNQQESIPPQEKNNDLPEASATRKSEEMNDNKTEAVSRSQDVLIDDDDEDDDEDEEIDEYDDQDDDQDVPEYSEEVSSEDFKEFIGIAIEELESGDELAEAIITEMIKIAQAQPDHIQQVKSFYLECSEKPGISSENQKLCIKYLEQINESSN